MKDKIKVGFFALLFFSLFLMNITSSNRVFSNLENRVLQQFPNININNIFDDTTRLDIENFTNDQFIARDAWISIKTLGDLALGKKDNGRIYFGKDSFLFDVDKPIDTVQLDKNIEVLNTFIASQNASVQALLIPTKSQVYSYYLPKNAPILQETLLLHKVSQELNIPVIDSLKVLSNASDSLLYYKTDHHWTTQGAFKAYQLLLEDEAKPWDDFNIKTVTTDFHGSQYRKANSFFIKADSMDIIYDLDHKLESITIDNKTSLESYYVPKFLDSTDKYAYLLGGDHGLVDIKTKLQNNKEILIIKDSFANSLVPFLVEHYERIVLIDPRHYKMGIEAYLSQQNFDQILFVFNTQTILQDKTLANILK